jgi:hypothetical protein
MYVQHLTGKSPFWADLGRASLRAAQLQSRDDHGGQSFETRVVVISCKLLFRLSQTIGEVSCGKVDELG